MGLSTSLLLLSGRRSVRELFAAKLISEEQWGEVAPQRGLQLQDRPCLRFEEGYTLISDGALTESYKTLDFKALSQGGRVQYLGLLSSTNAFIFIEWKDGVLRRHVEGDDEGVSANLGAPVREEREAQQLLGFENDESADPEELYLLTTRRIMGTALDELAMLWDKPWTQYGAYEAPSAADRGPAEDDPQGAGLLTLLVSEGLVELRDPASIAEVGRAMESVLGHADPDAGAQALMAWLESNHDIDEIFADEDQLVALLSQW